MNETKRTPTPPPSYTIGEELGNSILHGIGTIGAIAGLVLLLLKTGGAFGGQRLSVMDINSVIIYGSIMIIMFLTSTLYHSIQQRGAKLILQKIDHSAIYIFIAGTYTPFCVIVLEGAWRWGIIAFEWFLAIGGVTLNIIGFKNLKKIEIIAYILMGWAILFGSVPMIRAMPIKCLILLVLGGICYTMGIFWYRRKSIRYTHVIWHVFVLIGSFCHWLSLWYYVSFVLNI